VLRLARLTDYAIVVLAHMARHAHLCVHPATELAAETGVPLPTVQKVLKTLAGAGLVESRRGARGGYALAADPAGTTLLTVIERLEGPIGLTDCAIASVVESATGGCSDHDHCVVGDHWPVLNEAVRGALDGVTLLTLARRRPRSATARAL
jgi:FeS assembly SUF system regulator